jgi:uncharacterized membrane protein
VNRDRGSTLPLILGFFLIALLVVAGGVAASDAFVQQRALQDVCDGAAAAAAAGAGDIARGDVGGDGYLHFGNVQQAVDAYVARDAARSGVHVTGAVSADGTTIRLTCEQTTHIAFGAMFGKGDGVHHVAHASARAPLSSGP